MTWQTFYCSLVQRGNLYFYSGIFWPVWGLFLFSFVFCLNSMWSFNSHVWHYSFAIGCNLYYFSLILSPLILNDEAMVRKLLATSLFTKSSEKNYIKRRVVSIYFELCFSPELKCGVKNEESQQPTNVSHVCVSCMIFPTLRGTDVSLQSLSCVCLLGDEYSSLTCRMSHPFSVHL